MAAARKFTTKSDSTVPTGHWTRKNVLGKIDESGPFSQPLPGAFHDEPPFSGSFNVSMESKGKNVDVSLNVSGTPRCDEASSSGYSDLPKRSEGQDFDVNLKIPGAPRCDEAPSSSSSSGPPKSRSDLNRSKLISSKRKVDDDLWKHISELRKLREEGNHKTARSLGHFPWPDVPALKKLKEIVSFGTHLPINEIDGAVQAILKQMGRVNVATAAALVVACILERYDFYTPREKFWHLVKEMHYLAIGLKGWSENPERMPEVMEEATSLIIEGVLLFSAQFDCSRSASEVHAIREMLNIVHMRIKITVHVFTPEKYPTHADNGQVLEDLLLTLQQEVDINTGQVEEDALVPGPQKAYIHNSEQVEEDALVPGPQKAYIHNSEQVEEDPYIHNNEQVEEDLPSSRRQKGFKMEALVAATDNFHEDNKLGRGGFGAVYKGTTDDGKQIAVKKMLFTDGQCREGMEKQFENEKLLADVQHRNLVNLLGYCEQGLERFLVYEYLPNGSLDKFLSDPEKQKRLDWHKRYKIIEGTARGLLYLHEDSPVRIVHQDIKSGNILLDKNLKPKIADFGTAKRFPEDTTHVDTTRPAGTRGYMAPECAMVGKITVKADVHSFGVVIFELLTGKLRSEMLTEYFGWVWRSYTQNKVADTIDRTITETWDKEKKKVLRCFRVALLCIQEDETLRPTMSEVITMLSSSDRLPVPEKPWLVFSPTRSCF